MEHFKQLSSQQLALAAAGATVVAVAVMARNVAFGVCALLVALACGIGALAKSRTR